MTKKEYKKLKVWEFLKNNKSITSKDAIYKFHYTRLSDLIHVWRKNGIEIKDKRESNPDGANWKRYFITATEAKRAERKDLVRGKAC